MRFAAGQSADAAILSAGSLNRVDSLRGVVANLDNVKKSRRKRHSRCRQVCYDRRRPESSSMIGGQFYRAARGYICELTGGTDSVRGRYLQLPAPPARQIAVANYYRRSTTSRRTSLSGRDRGTGRSGERF